jgi:hypothetical protein
MDAQSRLQAGAPHAGKYGGIVRMPTTGKKSKKE